MITAVNITAQDIIENNAHLIIELAQAGELKCVTKYVTTDGGRLTPASFLCFLAFPNSNNWNASHDHREKIYISYDSTNKNSQAGALELVE